jgi:hypothetical protein
MKKVSLSVMDRDPGRKTVSSWGILAFACTLYAGMLGKLRYHHILLSLPVVEVDLS